MKTDIDRLHDVVDGKKFSRGCGKTFAKCHEVLGFVELGHINIFCIIALRRDVSYIEHMLTGIFKERGIELVKVRSGGEVIYRALESTIRMLPESSNKDKMRGLEGIMVFMRHSD